MAVDGKSLRGSFDRASDQAAMGERLDLVPGQLAIEVKSNESTPIPMLLRAGRQGQSAYPA